MSNFIVKGPVMIPGQSDRAGDRPMSPEEIQKAAYQFASGFPIIDYQHSFQKIADVVESFITPEETDFNGMQYPAGTWFITANVTDPEVQNGIKNGELTGYSVAALPEKNYDDLRRIIPDNVVSKSMFKDVDDGAWFPLTVSIVDIPCVPEAVFKAFDESDIVKKSLKENENMVDEKRDGVFEKLVDFLINKADAPVKEQAQPAEGQTAEDDPVAELKKEIADLTSRIEKLEGANEVPVEKEAEEVESIEKEAEPIKKTAEVEEEKEEVISKALPIDGKGKVVNTSLMERLGCDSRGRNKKYM